MAVEQGICKNCGSLIVYNTADEVCECIFCNASFPSSELISVDADTSNINFPNEKYEKNGTAKHQYSVLPDQVQPAVDRQARSQTLSPEIKEKVEYEVQAKDVKAPKKVVITLSAIAAAILIITVVISLPIYKSRSTLLSKMQNNMGAVVSGVANIDTTIDEDGFSKSYFIFGNKCENVILVTEDDIDNSKATALFNNYCDQRKNASSSIKNNDDVEMTIYAAKGIYKITDGGEVEFLEDSKPLDKE